MDYETILLEREGQSAVLTVNRPGTLNALNTQVLSEMKDALWNAWNDDGVGALILTGAGDRAFVAGADISEMQPMSPSMALEFGELGHSVCRMLETMPKPVIAAVNGYALGGGCELSLACDVVYASTKAIFGQPEVKLGIIPGFGGTVRLPRAVGLPTALEWILSGNRYTAKEAMEAGLVCKVFEPEELMPAALNLALAICSGGRNAVAAAKRLIREGLTVPHDAALRTEVVTFANLFDTREQKDGMDAFLNPGKTKPGAG